jgi:hypothetical protein
MPRLELIFLNSANGGGCFRWRDEDSSYLRPNMRRALNRIWFSSSSLALAE